MIEIIKSQLECFNDINLEFDPKLHKYTYDGVPFTSVTRFIERFHKPFDNDFWSKRKETETGFQKVRNKQDSK